jgi:uncharacterized protein (TIGR02391 family)
MNCEWALGELHRFLQMTEMTLAPPVPGFISTTAYKNTASSDEKIAREAVVVEQISDRVLPGWRKLDANNDENRWMQHRAAALRSEEVLKRQEELAQNLGENAPELSAAKLHPWVWAGAKSLWQSGHYREAVEAAAKKVNAKTQNRVDRRDVSETDLFKQSFSKGPPAPGKARLRRMADDGSKTFDSVQRGAMSLAEGIFAGMRNPLSHEEGHELSEQEALEYLAALSVLARWVDDAEGARKELTP